MKRSQSILTLLLALAMVFSLAACAAEKKPAEAKETAAVTEEDPSAAPNDGEDLVLERDGYKLTVPADLAALMTIDVESDEMFFSFSETASLEAAEAAGGGTAG